jgi:hypothetical protein
MLNGESVHLLTHVLCRIVVRIEALAEFLVRAALTDFLLSSPFFHYSSTRLRNILILEYRFSVSQGLDIKQ